MKPTSLLQRVYKKILQPYYNRKFDWDGVQVFFIVSTGRTATQFLANYLQENYKRDVVALHEPVPDFLNSGIDVVRKKMTKKQLINFIKLNRSLQCKMVREDDKTKIYVESNNNVTVSMNELSEVFPLIKFIHVIRDPKTYIGSSLNKINTREKGDYTMYSPSDNRPRITPLDFNEKITQEEWDDFSQFKKVAWYWNKMNSFILEYSKVNNNIITVKYEDIFLDSEHKGLHKILDFIGLPVDISNNKFPISKRMNAASGKKDHGASSWSQDQIDFYEKTVSATAKSFNYN